MQLDGHKIGLCSADVVGKRSRCREEETQDFEVSPSIDHMLRRTWGTQDHDVTHESGPNKPKILVRVDNHDEWVALAHNDYSIYDHKMDGREDVINIHKKWGWQPAKLVDLSIDSATAAWCLPLPKEPVAFQELTKGIFDYNIELSPYELVQRMLHPKSHANHNHFVEIFCGTATLTAAVAAILKDGVIKTLDNRTTPDIDNESLEISHINQEFMGAWRSSHLDVWRMGFKWFGFPCQTFSMSATTSSAPHHGRKFETMWLGTTPEAKRANLMLSYIYSVFHEIVKQGLDIGYFCFENPVCNFTNHPIVRRMCMRIEEGGLGARIVRVSYCAFGKVYRKQTVLVTNHPRIIECFEDDTACCCANGLCEFTGGKHTNLNKQFDLSHRMVECRHASGGVVKRHRITSSGLHAKEAEPYPEAFCQAIADLVYTKLSVDHIRRKYIASRYRVHSAH